MKLTRVLSFILLFTLLFSCASADESDPFGDWLSEMSKWAEQAGDEVSKWAEQAGTDISRWAEQAGVDISKWAEDVPGWIEGAWSDVSKWVGQAWDGTSEWAAGKWSEFSQWADAEKRIDEAYTYLLGRILNQDDIPKVMDSIKSFAEGKGITNASVKVILLPYLARLVTDSQKPGSGELSADGVARYLTGVIETLGIENEEQALQMISGTKETPKTE